MFETLTNRLEGAIAKLKGKGTLSEADVDAALGEIRLALLEADVNVDVVRGITERIRTAALDTEVSKALNPGQQVVKVVLTELTASLGGEPLAITYASKPPTVVLLAGLQGTGKTTNAAKLARWFRSQGRNPLLVGADLQRPGAVDQLRTLAERSEIPVFSESSNPVKVAKAAIKEAIRTARDVVIIDTAGRLAIDDEMMAEVRRISDAVSPHFTFLIADAMTGQDAVNSAKAFHDTLALDAVILTKLDGDARGGAALSVAEVVGRPIAFASVGEGLDDFEAFYPERMASRILGMGDIETLIEKAEETFDEAEATAAAARLMQGVFTFDDFLDMTGQVLKMGSLRSIMGMMPGMNRQLQGADIDESRLTRITGMVHSMTPEERAQPDLIDGSRRRRIAMGAGVKTGDVKTLVDQFKQMRSMMRNVAGQKSGQKKSGKMPGGMNIGGMNLPGIDDLQLPANATSSSGKSPNAGISPRGGRGARRPKK